MDNCMPNLGNQSPQGSVVLLWASNQIEMAKKTAAIIVSFCSGSSSDPHFTNTPQKSEEGTKTLVYKADSAAVDQLIDGFEGKFSTETIRQLFKEMSELDPDCTVFNWECSSGYSSGVFPEGPGKVLKLVSYLLKGRHMVMFSDFSLKALIPNWDAHILGPNPFEKLPTDFGGSAALKFDPIALKESPSAQLQSVGDLSVGGVCNVQCPGGTITYTINRKSADNKSYELQVLTIVTNIAANKDKLVETKFGSGLAGHVLLSYPNGGRLLASMTHWAGLVQVDTTEEQLINIAQKQYGAMEVAQIETEMNGMNNEMERREYVRNRANDYVKNSAPGNNKAQKAKYNQK